MASFPPSYSVSPSISYSIHRLCPPLYGFNSRSRGDLFFRHRRRLQFPLLAPLRLRSPPHASKRFSSYPQEAVVVVPDPRAWAGDLGHRRRDDEDEEDDDDEEEEEDDRSLDLLARFLHNVFRKVSRRARKAARSVLPPAIPTKLVGFSVNGVLMLAFLWILKAFLEVVCTLGSMVFVSILLVRGVWSGMAYIRENQYNYASRIDDDDDIRWSGVQPA